MALQANPREITGRIWLAEMEEQTASATPSWETDNSASETKGWFISLRGKPDLRAGNVVCVYSPMRSRMSSKVSFCMTASSVTPIVALMMACFFFCMASTFSSTVCSAMSLML